MAITSVASGHEPWPLFLYGPAGRGKTCAALYLADRAYGDVRWRDFADLAAELADVKCGRVPCNARCDVPLSLTDFWAGFDSFELVIIDEAGLREAPSPTQYEALKTLLDRRQGRPLAIVSNIGLEGIARIFDDRIASRLAAGTVVHVEGPDQRIAQRDKLHREGVQL